MIDLCYYQPPEPDDFVRVPKDLPVDFKKNYRGYLGGRFRQIRNSLSPDGWLYLRMRGSAIYVAKERLDCEFGTKCYSRSIIITKPDLTYDHVLIYRNSPVEYRASNNWYTEEAALQLMFGLLTTGTRFCHLTYPQSKSKKIKTEAQLMAERLGKELVALNQGL